MISVRASKLQIFLTINFLYILSNFENISFHMMFNVHSLRTCYGFIENKTQHLMTGLNHKILILPLIFECSALTVYCSLLLHASKLHTKFQKQKTSQIKILLLVTCGHLSVQICLLNWVTHYFISQQTVSLPLLSLDKLTHGHATMPVAFSFL